MNDILDKYGSLSLSVKALIVFGFLVATSGLHYFMFTMQEEEQTALLSRRASLEEKKYEYELKHKALEIDKKFNRDLERKLSLKKGKLPDKTEVEKVIAVLDVKAEESGVKIDTISPKKEKVKDLYVEKPLEIKIHGGFHKMMNFLYKISKAERIINMDDIELTSPFYKNQEVILSGALTLKVYRFKKSSDTKNKKKKKRKGKK